MSFDINLSKNLSNVQASSKTTDGGAGNTGYFQRESQEDNNLLTFTKDYPVDTFEKIELPEETDEESFLDVIEKVFASIIKFIKKLFNQAVKK